MVNALVRHGKELVEIKLPMDRLDLEIQIHSMHTIKRPKHIHLTNNEEDKFQVKLSADSDFENSVLAIFNKSHTLDELNACLFKLKYAREEILEDMEGDILHGQFESPQKLMEELENRTNDLIGVRVDYYCPLQVEMEDAESGEDYVVSNHYAVAYEDAIREKLMQDQEYDLHDGAFYFNQMESIKEKLVSVVWDIKEVDGTVYGVIHTALTEGLTAEEEKVWKDYLIGQAADGYGEHFNNKNIQAGDEHIKISFYCDEGEYFMENENEFENRTAGEQCIGIQM